MQENSSKKLHDDLGNKSRLRQNDIIVKINLIYANKKTSFLSSPETESHISPLESPA